MNFPNGFILLRVDPFFYFPLHAAFRKEGVPGDEKSRFISQGGPGIAPAAGKGGSHAGIRIRLISQTTPEKRGKQDMRIQIQKAAALLLALLLALSMTACGGAKADEPKTDDTDTTVEENNSQTEEEPVAERHPDSLTLAIASEPTSLNPYNHASVVSGYMNQMTYNKLFRLDTDTLEPVPELCESYENIDELTWRFKIHEGVYFHDGVEMTAEDVKASMEYARTFTESSRYTGFWESVEIVDPYTVEIKTNSPHALILNDLANGNTIVPKHLIDEGNDFNQNPIGSGPYKYVEWVLGDCVKFVRNDNYWDEAHQPQIAEITWRAIPEGTSRTIALEAGEVDVVIDVDTNDIDRLKADEEIEVLSKAGTRMAFFGMNNEAAPFDNENFRKAVTAAIDREAVMMVAVNGQGIVSESLNPSVFQGSSQEGVIHYDVEQAKAYLAESGIDPATVTFTCMTYTDETRRTAEVIQAYLQEIGITMEIESLDFAAWLERLLSGDFETSVGGYTASDLLTYMKGLWHSSSIGASNLVRLRDPEIDGLIDKAMTQLDPEARTATLEEISRKINDKALFVSLYTTTVVRAYDADLQGMQVSASGGILYQDLRWAE